MSWFIGFTGRNPDLQDKISALTGDCTLKIQSPEITLHAGGNKETLHSKYTREQMSWVKAGIGITAEDKPTYLTEYDWNQAIEDGAGELHKLNGHFAICSWSGESVRFYTDQLGLRNIFFYEGTDSILFSTRLDWMLKLSKGLSVNWKVFGSRWLCINQFSQHSFIQGLSRLSQGGTAEINGNTLSLNHNPWQYRAGKISSREIAGKLKNYSDISLRAGQPLSLGLSGGLDSRTLQALLVPSGHQALQLHTFARANHPDLKIARKLASSSGNQLRELQIPELQEEQIINQLPSFVIRKQLISTPQSMEDFECYQDLKSSGFHVIDGGFGEIGRRRFLASVYFRNKKTLFNGDIETLFQSLRLHRASVFNRDFNSLMKSGALEDLKEAFSAMPSASEIGIENWLDLFTIRTRVPNAAGPEQARSDDFLFNYMPFLQPTLLSDFINLSLSERKNARLFRRIIHEKLPELENYPLVKGVVTYPYWMKDKLSAAWMRIRKKTGAGYEGMEDVHFLQRIETYVRDLFNSSSCRQFDAYDTAAIQELIEEFYDQDNHSRVHELSWWLTFEVFRLQMDDF